PVAGLHQYVRPFAGRGLVERLLHGAPLGGAAGHEQRRSGLALAAALQPPGAIVVAVGELAAGDLGVEAAPGLGRAETAAELARPARILDQPELLGEPGIARLVDLHGDDAAVAVDRIGGVVAIGEAPRAPADHLDVVAGEILVVLLVL